MWEFGIPRPRGVGPVWDVGEMVRQVRKLPFHAADAKAVCTCTCMKLEGGEGLFRTKMRIAPRAPRNGNMGFGLPALLAESAQQGKRPRL